MKKILNVFCIMLSALLMLGNVTPVHAASAPAKIHITKLSRNSNQFTVKWSKASNVSGYQIQYAPSSKFEKAARKTVKIKGNKTFEKTVKGLKGNKRYYVKVRSYKTVQGKTAYSAWSNYKSIVTLTNPKPTAITALEDGNKSFKVQWKKVSGVKGYQIQYSTQSYFESYKTVNVSSEAATSKTISGLPSGKKYYVRVRTYKIKNKKKVCSSWSSDVYKTKNGIKLDCWATTGKYWCDEGGKHHWEAGNTNEMFNTWDKMMDSMKHIDAHYDLTDGYDIGGGNFLPIQCPGCGKYSLMWLDTYYYHPERKPAGIKHDTSLKAPEIKVIESNYSESIDLEWSKTANVSGYQIQYCENSKFKEGRSLTVHSCDILEYGVSGYFKPGKTYVRMRAYKTVKKNGKNIEKYSPWSKVKSVKVKK